MSEKRMTFVAAMVQGFLANRKFQTRRVWPIQPGPGNDSYVKFDEKTGVASWPGESEFDSYTVKSRYLVGDLVWVSESCCAVRDDAPGHLTDKGVTAENWGLVVYRASTKPDAPYFEHGGFRFRWCTGRFMFKWQARLWREVVAVRAQQVNNITPEDAIAEGVESAGDGLYCNYLLDRRGDNLGTQLHPVESYRTLWDSLHKDHPFSSRPWVFAYTLRPVEAPKRKREPMPRNSYMRLAERAMGQ